MKQFRKWEDNIKNYYTSIPTYEHMTIKIGKHEARSEGWRAALKWALSHKKPIKYNDYKFDYIKTDVIEEELKET